MKREESSSSSCNAFEELCTELLLSAVLHGDAGIGRVYLH